MGEDMICQLFLSLILFLHIIIVKAEHNYIIYIIKMTLESISIISGIVGIIGGILGCWSFIDNNLLNLKLLN